MKGTTIEKYGVHVTIFENGDVYVGTRGDVTVTYARALLVGGKIVSLDEVASLDENDKDSD